MPYLEFEIKVSGLNPSNNIVLTQDVPVRILGSEQIQELREPALPDPPVQIILPPLKDLRSIIDRYLSQ